MLGVVCSVSSIAQSPQRDSSAIAFLAQAVSAAGGSSAIGVVQDFTAQGTITHNWDDDPVQGQLTLKSRGLSQFRINSDLPEGTWSSILSNGVGQTTLPDGTVRPSPPHNIMNDGSLTWPIASLNAVLSDRNTTVVDMGLVRLGAGQAREISVQQNLRSDRSGFLSKLTKRQYFFDPSSSALLRVQDVVHPDHDSVNAGVTRILDFGNYQRVNGLLVPFSIRQTINGQQVWSIQLSSIAFNTGLSDSDFQF